MLVGYKFVRILYSYMATCRVTMKWKHCPYLVNLHPPMGFNEIRSLEGFLKGKSSNSIPDQASCGHPLNGLWLNQFTCSSPSREFLKTNRISWMVLTIQYCLESGLTSTLWAFLVVYSLFCSCSKQVALLAQLMRFWDGDCTTEMHACSLPDRSGKHLSWTCYCLKAILLCFVFFQ